MRRSAGDTNCISNTDRFELALAVVAAVSGAVADRGGERLVQAAHAVSREEGGSSESAVEECSAREVAGVETDGSVHSGRVAET